MDSAYLKELGLDLRTSPAITVSRPGRLVSHVEIWAFKRPISTVKKIIARHCNVKLRTSAFPASLWSLFQGLAACSSLRGMSQPYSSTAVPSAPAAASPASAAWLHATPVLWSFWAMGALVPGAMNLFATTIT